MNKLFSNMALLLFSILSVNVAHAAGIVFIFGSNITPVRQAALEAAAAELEQIIDFRQDIKISVSFPSLFCGGTSAVLGWAGPEGNAVYSNFSGAPQRNVWYVSAQAADFGFADAINDSAHISAEFNHQMDNAGCLQGAIWYYGTDHNPPPGQIDFLGTAVHEFMHGLGFISFIGGNGKLSGGLIDNYSTFIFDNSTNKSWKKMTHSQRAASILHNGNLVWNGKKTTSMASLLQAGTAAGKVQLYAPLFYEAGSSISHFDTSVHYNSDADEAMEPQNKFPQENIMASAVFCDMGWNLLRDTDGDGINDCDDVYPIDADNDGALDVLDAFPNDSTEQADTDNDGIGDNADVDADNDGVLDMTDNCLLIPNPDQMDWGSDGIGDLCDSSPQPSDTSGNDSKDKTGSSVAFAGDVNNDGYGDYVIGISGYDIPAVPPLRMIKGAGRAIVISGKTGAVLMFVNGVAAKDAMGFAVAGGGDIDNDGFDDVVVGAPFADHFPLKDSGSVTILYGSASGTRTPVTIYGAAAKALSGSAVALGDTNDDSHADIIVGAPKDDDHVDALVDAGSVKIFSGTDLQLMQTYYGVTAKSYAGTSVAAGDIDVVTGADIIIGAPNDDDIVKKLKDTGSVAVYNIADAATPVIPKQYGAVAKAHLGKSVAAGDVNKDGRDDVITGAPGDDNGVLIKNTGSVAVFSGSDGAQLTKQYGAGEKVGLGNSVAAADVNDDGQTDIIVGASKDDAPASVGTRKIVDAGSVSIWSGNGFGLIDTLYGEATKDYSGFAVSAGDINSDGKADLIIGVAGDDIPANKMIKNGGAVKIVSGVVLPTP